jgi:hypothetical protein
MHYSILAAATIIGWSGSVGITSPVVLSRGCSGSRDQARIIHFLSSILSSYICNGADTVLEHFVVFGEDFSSIFLYFFC